MRKLAPIALGLFLVLPGSAQRQPNPGRELFASRCAACHGGDGNGGEFAPGIVTRLAALSDAEVASIVHNGVPARGMPAFGIAVAVDSAKPFASVSGRWLVSTVNVMFILQVGSGCRVLRSNRAN